MLTPEQYARIQQILPFLRQAEPQLARDFQSQAFFACILAGKDVFIEGDQVEAIALLISGVVRVYKIGETGREITLYRFGLGESCILTANAILSRKSFPAIATVEKDAEAVMIPAEVFRDWVRRHDLWREFVFELLSDRLSTVMAVVDEVIFQRMDRRVAAWLLKQALRLAPSKSINRRASPGVGRNRHHHLPLHRRKRRNRSPRHCILRPICQRMPPGRAALASWNRWPLAVR